MGAPFPHAEGWGAAKPLYMVGGGAGVSSTITIGFLDRTRVCIEAEFTPPIADDERRELLIHAALLTGRAFASLSYERQ